MSIRAANIVSLTAFCLLLVPPLATTANLNYVVSSSPPLIPITSLSLSFSLSSQIPLLGFACQCVHSNGLIFFFSFLFGVLTCRIWQSFLICLVFYTAWVCPFEFGFLDKVKGPLAITDNVVNGLFGIDVILTFFVAYLDKTSYLLIDTPKLIALRYAKTWLAFDIISTIPSEVAQQVLPHALANYGFFNTLRLWRLRRVSAMFARYKLWWLL